jgi:hypothetical protein
MQNVLFSILTAHTRHINVYYTTSICWCWCCCCCCCCCCCWWWCIRTTFCLEKVPPEDSTPTCSFEAFLSHLFTCHVAYDAHLLKIHVCCCNRSPDDGSSANSRNVGCQATGCIQHTSIYSSFIDINIKIILFIGMNGMLLEASPYLFPPLTNNTILEVVRNCEVITIIYHIVWSVYVLCGGRVNSMQLLLTSIGLMFEGNTK